MTAESISDASGIHWMIMTGFINETVESSEHTGWEDPSGERT